MWKFVFVSLLPTAILATDYGVNPHDIQTSKPMDYYEDVRNGGIKPDSNLVFNFEQFRRDQPPQVEMREERIGRYMYRRPVTTTTTTTEQPIVVPDFSHNIPDNVQDAHNSLSQLSNLLPPLKSNNQRQWNSDPSPSNWAPPPPPPSWNDFPKTFNNQPSNYEQNVQNFAQKINNFDHSSQPHLSQVVPESSIIPRGDFANVNENPNSIPQSKSAQITAENKKAPVKHFGRHNIHHPINEPVHSVTRETGIRHTELTRNNKAAHNPQVNRGSHKYSWSDVTETPEMKQSSTSATPVQFRSQPPPVPTLSPWVGDNYGK